MPAKKFSDDERQQAVSGTLEHLATGASMVASLKVGADLVGAKPSSVRYWAAHMTPPVVLSHANAVQTRNARTAAARAAHRIYALEDLRQQAFDLNEIAEAGIRNVRARVQTESGEIDDAKAAGEVLADVGRLAVIVQRVARIDADIDRRGIHQAAQSGEGTTAAEKAAEDPREHVDELEAGWRVMQGGKA